MVKMEHILEKRPGFTGAWDEKDDDWPLVRNEYKKATALFLDAETSTGLIVHVIRTSPCIRGVTMTKNSCVA